MYQFEFEVEAAWAHLDGERNLWQQLLPEVRLLSWDLHLCLARACSFS